MRPTRAFITGVAAYVLTSLLAQAQIAKLERNPIDEALDLLEIDTRAYTLFGERDYGILGSVGVSVPVLSLRPLANGALFGGELSVHPILGTGTRFQKGNIGSAVPMRYAEVRIDVPLLHVTKPMGLRPPIVLSVTPGLGFALMKNYATGNDNGIGMRSLGFNGDIQISDALTLSVEYRWTELDPRDFLWTSHYRSFGVGISLSLGSCARQFRQYKREAEGVLMRTGQRMSLLQDSLVQTRQQLQSATQVAAQQADIRLSRELQDVKGELQTLQRQIQESRSEPQQTVQIQTSSPLASLDPSISSAIAYDDRRLPQTRLIRIEKQIFDHGDLIEEVYLKSILSILNNYDNFVWEIAFRDAISREGFAGRDLAIKIKHFFELYNSRFNRKLTLVHDDSIRSEYEIRCLGIAR